MLIDDLKEYYIKNKIYATNFNCKFKNECSKNCDKFTEAKAAFIPINYETSFIKLAFLSLDSGSSEAESEKRTIEGVRQNNEQYIVARLPKGRHWYETHYWATEILNKIGGYNIDIEDSKKYFAHINSAKCCQNKKSNMEADDILFKNCRVYLKEEIKIINPQIIVSQGKKAEYALLNTGEIIEKYNHNVCLLKIDEKFIMWIKTYHPSSYGYYYKQKRELKNILNELKERFNIISGLEL